MNINLFFLFLLSALILIQTSFEPLERKEQVVKKTPSLELENFKLSELDTKGLKNVMYAKRGEKYKSKYTVTDFTFLDASKSNITDISAKTGVYRGNILTLVGDVKYIRDDGLIFETQKANYNKKSNIMRSLNKYTSTFNGHKAIGSLLVYNNDSGIVRSRNITMKYNLKENK